AGLLLGAGVPDDHEQRGEADDHRYEAGPPRGQLAQAGAGQPAVERGERGVAHALLGVAALPVGGREQADDGGGEEGRYATAEQYPQREHHPVAAQDQADQPAATRERAHRATPAGADGVPPPPAAPPAGIVPPRSYWRRNSSSSVGGWLTRLRTPTAV